MRKGFFSAASIRKGITDAVFRLALHPKQLKVFHDPAQVRVLCSGRGFGKSVLLLTVAIFFCLTYREPINPRSPQVALIAMPTLKMARAIHWIPILNLLEKLPIVEKIDKSDFRVVWKGERPDLVLRGADRQGDRLRGLNICFAGLDEYQDFDPSVWKEVLDGALARNKNWRALIIGTPKGKATHFHQFHLDAIARKNWSYYHFTTFDNPFISRKELRRAYRELPGKVFRQEYRASWEDFEGQLFPNISDHHKATAIPTNFKGVLVGGDWGDLNPFLMVIGVSHTGDYYMIDFFENTTGMPVTSDEIELTAANFERQHGVGKFFLPDDRPASIKSFRRYGKQHGLQGMRKTVQVVRSQPGVMERALIGNSLFYQNRLWFGPKCHELYDRFASYHRAKNSAGELLSEPAKGQDDHAIDALLYVVSQLEGKYIKKTNATGLVAA